MPAQKKDAKRDWVTINTDTLRVLGRLVTIVIIGTVVFLGYLYRERRALQTGAEEVIARARSLLQDVQAFPERDRFREEIDEAYQALETGQEALDQSQYASALQDGRRSARLLETILDIVRDPTEGGEAQFVSVFGDVEFRRGERGEWQEARSRVSLKSGDYVKTGGNGTAEVMFADSTLYRVRPDTLFVVREGRGPQGQARQNVKLEFGLVNVSTAARGSTVATPRASARVSGQSEAEVAYDREADEGRFAAYRGGVEVEAGGVTRNLAELQALTQAGEDLSQPEALPSAPTIRRPVDRSQIDIDEVHEIVLEWDEITGAERYSLQISRSSLFVENLIEDLDREQAKATLGVQGTGAFLWRVAAVNSDGLRGPWSEPSQFQIASLRGAGEGDETPPFLEVEGIQSYGSIFIVSGRTDPGATMTINDEAVKVAADGTFDKTIQLLREGWGFLEVSSLDAAGNEAVRRHRVFVEHL